MTLPVTASCKYISGTSYWKQRWKLEFH